MILKCTTHKNKITTSLALLGSLTMYINTVLLFILFIFSEKHTVLLGSGNAHMIKPAILMVVYWSDLKRN